MACCGLGPTFGAMESMGINAFHTVLITGLGPVGLGGVINATFRGARVIAIESNPYRARLAGTLGAEVVLNPDDRDILDQISEITGGTGPDVGIDCTGVPQAQRLLIDAVRRKGRVGFVGEGGPLEIKVSDDMIRKGLTLHGIWHYNLSGYPGILQVLRASLDKINALITHVYPLSKVREAWDLQLTGACGKVVLHPWAEE